MDPAPHHQRRSRSPPTRPRHSHIYSPQPDVATPPLKRMRVDIHSSHLPPQDHARNHGRHGSRGTVHLPQQCGSPVNLITKRAGAPSTTIDASDLFKNPQRASRPDRFVVILRGLPGSGKSYLAKALRDVEVMNGGSAPRIHSMDDYFMIEVEKDVGEGKDSKSGGKRLTKKVFEYCYEAEMEETYRSCMLKAFRKTLDERNFNFVVVDDRNLREADFSQFWAAAKKSGYEVYLLDAPYKDPVGCAARNLHGFSLDDIQKMAAEWEQAPQWLYLHLDIQSLFHGDDLKEEALREVNINIKKDMVLPTQDVADNNDNRNNDRAVDEKPKSPGDGYDTGPLTGGEMWDTDTEEEQVCVRDLSQSKWLRNIEEEMENPESSKGKEEPLFVRDLSQSNWSRNTEEETENPESSKVFVRDPSQSKWSRDTEEETENPEESLFVRDPSQSRWSRDIEEETENPEESIYVRDLSDSKWSKDIEGEMEKADAFKGKEDQIPVKGLDQSKWLRNVEENIENPEASKGNGHVPSGLVQDNGKSRKSVHWGDRADLVGFSIGSAASKPTNLSLVIGPGSGYNLKSNPLSKEEKESWNCRKKIISEKNKRSREQLRAEWRSVKTIFEQRKPTR